MTILEDLKAGRLVVVPPVSVKPLEWQASPSKTTWYANTPAGRYFVWGLVPNQRPSQWCLEGHAGVGAVVETDDAAKAAAQADYEARILSALTASPDHTAGLIALVEGMERERDEAEQALRTVQNAAKTIASAHGTELEHLRQNARFDHALRAEVESLRQHGSEMTDALLAAEARALAAEAERDAAFGFISDLVNMQSGQGWSRSVVREAAANFLAGRGVKAPHGPDKTPDMIARALTEKNNGNG